MTGWARDARYSTVAIAFHWTIAVLIIANLIIGIGHDGIPALRALMGAHKAIGITVLVLTLARVAWRIAHRPPPLPAHMPGWEKGLAHATHWSLYLLMLALPLTGWLMVSAPPTDGPARPLTWFGLFDIPRLPASAGAAGFGHEAHELLGWVMVALVVLHVAGALRHHLILRDNVLARMVPMQRR